MIQDFCFDRSCSATDMGNTYNGADRTAQQQNTLEHCDFKNKTLFELDDNPTLLYTDFFCFVDSFFGQ